MSEVQTVYSDYSPSDSNHYKGATKPLPVLTTQRRFVFVGHFLDKLDYADNLWTRIIVRCEGFGRRNHLDGLTLSKICSDVEE